MIITKNIMLLIVDMVRIIKKKIRRYRIMFAAFLSWLGELSASMGTKACTVWLADEPKMPKSLLNK